MVHREVEQNDRILFQTNDSLKTKHVMEHYRRRKLIRALNDMYLQNFKASEDMSYNRVQNLIKCYTIVKQKMDFYDVPGFIHQVSQDEGKQLPLF
jgi:hypothetical protein